MMWPPAMQQHPGASLSLWFHFVARRIESPRAGTRYCVQYLIHQMSTASLARLGQMAPCPLHLNNWNDGKIPKIKGNHPWQSVHELEVLHLFRCSTHTHALQKEAFRHRNSTAFSPESFYTDAFAQRCLYKQKLLHTEAFTQRSL